MRVRACTVAQQVAPRPTVIPAKAGIHFAVAAYAEKPKAKSKWIPAFAGMTATSQSHPHANASVARTSASVFSASNAEWPEAGVMTSSAFGQAWCRSQAFCTGQTTS